MTERSMPVPEGWPECAWTPGWRGCSVVANGGGSGRRGRRRADRRRTGGQVRPADSGALLIVQLPEAPAPVENTPVEVAGMTILYSDADIVAVDKPPGGGGACDGGLARSDGAWRPGRRGFSDQYLRHPRTAGHRPPPRCRHFRGDGGGTVRAGLHRVEAGLQAAHRGQALPRSGARAS